LGSHIAWDTRLDGKLAQAIVSLQAVKGVEIGFAAEGAAQFGSKVQDTIHYSREEHAFTRGVLAQITRLIGELPVDTDAEGLLGLRKGVTLVEAKSCQQIRAFDARKGYAVPDQAAQATETMPAWLRHCCRMAPQDASRCVRVARMLPSLPGTEAAFAAGDVSYSHVVQMVELARTTSVQDAVAAEATLLPLALVSHPGHLRTAAMRVRYCLDPDGSLKDLNRLYERRYVDLVETLGGMWMLQGSLDPEAGAKLKTALEAIMGPPAHDDPRSRQQRQADALVEMADQLMAADVLPTRGRRRPQVNVTVPLDTLQGVPGSEPPDLDMCTTPMPAETAQRAACDGEITRIILSPTSEVLDVGRSKRVAHPALDKAIRLRDKHCRWETCDRPAHQCDLHHQTPWWAGGRTDRHNMIMLCGYHHRMVHEGRQPLRLRALDLIRRT
jgi:hypothetical protein